MNFHLSVCIPVYNGEKTIKELVERISNSLCLINLEIILVNDGSLDNSEKICQEIAAGRCNVQFISLRRNFGEHNAVMCALNYVRGDFAVIIDDDFQNPPEEIIKLLQKAEEGHDLVFSKYPDKKHRFLRNVGSRFNNLVATWLLEKPFNLYLSSFKIISKDVVTEIIKYKGPFPYVDGLALRSTNNWSTVLVNHRPRREGESNYTFKRLVKLWLNMFINFSMKPLRFLFVAGLFLFFLSIAGIIFVIIEKLRIPDKNIGWASLMCFLLAFFGLQSIFLGMIGEFIGKILLNQNGTPQWVMKYKLN